MQLVVPQWPGCLPPATLEHTQALAVELAKPIWSEKHAKGNTVPGVQPPSAAVGSVGARAYVGRGSQRWHGCAGQGASAPQEHPQDNMVVLMILI
jgi:hypothetical protein